MFETYFNFDLFWIPIGPPIVLQGNSLRAVSVFVTPGSTSWEDWQTEHGKFINCIKLFVTNSVHVHKM